MKNDLIKLSILAKCLLLFPFRSDKTLSPVIENIFIVVYRIHQLMRADIENKCNYFLLLHGTAKRIYQKKTK